MSSSRPRPPGAGPRPRPLGSGARLRRDRSVRADAQRRYRAVAAGDEVLAGIQASTTNPNPNPSPNSLRVRAGRSPSGLASANERGGEPADRGEEPTNSTLTPLTRRARALYEDSVVPVRAIAQLCGVSERTIYKYARSGGWRRRRACPVREPAVAAADRGRCGQPAADFAPLRGAGGRFIRRDQAERPVEHGLKALDPASGARAAAACERAAALSEAALKRALARRDAEADARTLAILVRAVRELAEVAAASRAKRRGGAGRAQARRLQDANLQAMRRATMRPSQELARQRVPPAAPPQSPPPAQQEPLSEQDRRINEIAARFYQKRLRDGHW